MITVDKHIANNANLLSGQGLGPVSGNVFHVAQVDTQAYEWFRGRIPTDMLFPSLADVQASLTADQGDKVIVGAKHVETIAAAGLSFAKAGIDYEGLGRGSNRPKLNFTATGSVFGIDAADIFIKNLLLTGGIDNVATMLDVNAADLTMEDCEIRDVTGNIVIPIVTDANADRMKLIRLVMNLSATGNGAEAIRITGGDDIEIISPKIYGNFSTAAIQVHTTAAVRLILRGTADNPAYVWNANASCVALVDTPTGSTGHIGPHIYIKLLTNGANITEAITGVTFQLFDPVHVCNLVNEKGMAINWTPSTDDA